MCGAGAHAAEDNTICPTVWETGETAAVCFSINYLTLDNSKVHAVRERERGRGVAACGRQQRGGG